MSKKATLFDMACKLFEYHSAERRDYNCKKYWQPIEGQTLYCMQEKNNHFSYFAVKVMAQNSGRTMGQLQMENSRATKFLFDHGPRSMAKLTSCSFCVLPLVQRELESPCPVHIYMASILKNKHFINIYTSWLTSTSWFAILRVRKFKYSGDIPHWRSKCSLSASSNQIQDGKSK